MCLIVATNISSPPPLPLSLPLPLPLPLPLSLPLCPRWWWMVILHCVCSKWVRDKKIIKEADTTCKRERERERERREREFIGLHRHMDLFYFLNVVSCFIICVCVLYCVVFSFLFNFSANISEWKKERRIKQYFL